MREIVLDTETTGLDPKTGHRLVEIGCIELINHISTGKTYQQYVNPGRDMPTAAFEIHGLSEKFLSEFPVFSEIVDSFLDFIGGDPLIIHNAGFDLGFLNAELDLLGRDSLVLSQIVDTVSMARKVFPGAPVSLDALCRRFGIDNSAREKHGALLDAELLAEVYLELRGGREPGLVLSEIIKNPMSERAEVLPLEKKNVRSSRPHTAKADELAAHRAFIRTLKAPLWEKGK
ncbi:MAG: DNA polymerase III subunit epsilon [Rhodospirillaceae bacterium]|nr:DNA polymerase III subunit epsilon [Rhodospirillaceae bacterium]